MARRDDDDAPWTRQLLVGVGVLAAVALIIGGLVSVVALGAAKLTGIDEAESEATQQPSLYIPSGEPTTRPDSFPDPNVPKSSSPEPTTRAPSPKPTKKNKKVRAISLQAYPHKVGANERINLTGVYQGGEGARLQVQRFEGGWKDFPVDTSVKGGQFSTYIFTGRHGKNRFRVIDTESGRKSNVVRVTVG